jgi:hypothetical protein
MLFLDLINAEDSSNIRKCSSMSKDSNSLISNDCIANMSILGSVYLISKQTNRQTDISKAK